ncbi:hypothetical protein KFL_006530120 [Klebsormidium nitens]|uniref:Cofactor assembly of complex C subunit B n=1 Tax=Klebsormidium nitens TaxID=105231 RepID=A0A1Y1IP40_KLENI|nr:hypothetical protein KFL_006530120 [Klebsormidium nitens]|eukprot:GAQ90546.1 hypothetical protein KFL_006530120 [Klebsormidium nitens]
MLTLRLVPGKLSSNTVLGPNPTESCSWSRDMAFIHAARNQLRLGILDSPADGKAFQRVHQSGTQYSPSAAILGRKRCSCWTRPLLRPQLPTFVWPNAQLTPFQTSHDSNQNPGRKSVRRRLSLCRASADQSGAPPEERDFFVENEGTVRALPLIAGGVGGLLVVLNRAVSGIAAVADASSAQSRADVLVLVLAATLLLTGLVWRSIRSRPTVSVELDGVPCLRVSPSLPKAAKGELLWAWDLLQRATRCRALVVIYRNKVALQAGAARASERADEAAEIDASELVRGKISSAVLRAGKANYFANLALFPGRFEFLGFLPENTQGLIVQPLGDEGLLLAATDTVRGFVPKDQAWIATLGEKLDTTLQDWKDGDEKVVEETPPKRTLTSL